MEITKPKARKGTVKYVFLMFLLKSVILNILHFDLTVNIDLMLSFKLPLFFFVY